MANLRFSSMVNLALVGWYKARLAIYHLNKVVRVFLTPNNVMLLVVHTLRIT